jgi:N-acetylmuramoyl-L-alanine amidase
VSSPPPKPAAPTSSGDRTLTRMLGLKIGRIVVDPGHGGHDTGTIGKGGLREKDLVLDVALELRTLLEEKLGAEVILTRDSDVFVSLEERTALANQREADLFISIHANSSSNRSISGVETYFLSFARTAAEREVAARENATSESNIRDLQDLVTKIARADKSAESRELAAIIQRQLYTGSRRLFPAPRNRGVRSAPFIVLIGANMPSVLAEVAFISNPKDEKLLKKEDNRQRLARALFSGIEGYMKTLGSDVAQSRATSDQREK